MEETGVCVMATLFEMEANATEANTEARYSVGTWDPDEQAYTPLIEVPSFNLTISELRRALKYLRSIGYSAHRLRDHLGSHDDNDWAVLVERTDGKSESGIMENWKR